MVLILTVIFGTASEPGERRVDRNRIAEPGGRRVDRFHVCMEGSRSAAQGQVLMFSYCLHLFMHFHTFSYVVLYFPTVSYLFILLIVYTCSCMFSLFHFSYLFKHVFIRFPTCS